VATSLEGIADARELSLTWSGHIFPRLRDIHTSFVTLQYCSFTHSPTTSLQEIANLERPCLSIHKTADASGFLGLPKLRALI
jgi:hypothetical protein